eukprot:scaffold1770_cov64-Cyclotella_meneghiniana.AAC.2
MDENNSKQEHDENGSSCDNTSDDTCIPNTESINLNEDISSAVVVDESTDDDAALMQTHNLLMARLQRHQTIKPPNSGLLPGLYPTQLSQTSQWHDIDSSIYMLFLIVTGIICCMGWYYHRVKKGQQEWRELSKRELEKIQERILASRNRVEVLEHSIDTKLDDVVSVTRCNSAGCTSSSTELDDAKLAKGYVDGSSGSIDQYDHSSSTKSVNSQDAITKIQPTEYLNNLANVRAHQQEQHEMKIASAKQRRQQEQKLRRKHLVDSLQHDVADEAHQRRQKVITQEQEAIVQSSDANVEITHQQTLLEELQEMERTALLQQQNLEYNEALQRDQERAKLKALEENQLKMRRRAVYDAKCRLLRSGVQLSGVLDDLLQEVSNKLSSESSIDVEEKRQSINHCVQVRLVLPSGRKFQAIFSNEHTIGLLHDFALVLLEREQLLRSQDMPENYAIAQEIDQSEDENANVCPDDADYVAVKAEWSNLFNRFSLVTTFPQATHDDMNLTLHQSGLIQNATLLVVVDS